MLCQLKYFASENSVVNFKKNVNMEFILICLCSFSNFGEKFGKELNSFEKVCYNMFLVVKATLFWEGSNKTIRCL